MKLLKLTHQLGALARSSAILASLVAGLAITACGGGGGSGGTGVTGIDNPISADTGFSQGVITGFGSIIVNGVRIDDSQADLNKRISDDDDEDSPGRGKEDLRLGMVVSVSSTGTGTATATASVISFGSELKGLVQSINGSTGTGTPTVTAGTQTLTVLGQTVLIGTRTVFDPSSLPNGFTSIRVGNVLEVHGHLDAASNTLTATRINRDDKANKYKITGNVSGLNSVSFKIGSSTINYAAIAGTNKLSVPLSNSITVKVSLNTTPTATDTWTAIRIKSAKKVLENRNKAEVEGLISDFTSNTNTFKVNGIPVQLTGTTTLPAGITLANGVNVEVHGSLVNGTLIASSVKLEGKDSDTNEDRGIELHGAVSTVDTGSRTFLLRGLTVSYTADSFKGRITEADLSKTPAPVVEVKGITAPNGTTVIAQKIKFDN
jgi:hypothetical protein